jgi:hypothetical protein
MAKQSEDLQIVSNNGFCIYIFSDHFFIFHLFNHFYMKYLGFPIPAELEAKILTLLDNMKKAEDKTKYANELYSIVQELSHVGLDYFFVMPLKTAKIGMLKMKSVEMALSMGKQGIFSVAKGILKSMNNEQLEVIINLFENSLTVKAEK